MSARYRDTAVHPDGVGAVVDQQLRRTTDAVHTRASPRPQLEPYGRDALSIERHREPADRQERPGRQRQIQQRITVRASITSRARAARWEPGSEHASDTSDAGWNSASLTTRRAAWTRRARGAVAARAWKAYRSRWRRSTEVFVAGSRGTRVAALLDRSKFRWKFTGLSGGGQGTCIRWWRVRVVLPSRTWTTAPPAVARPLRLVCCLGHDERCEVSASAHRPLGTRLGPMSHARQPIARRRPGARGRSPAAPPRRARGAAGRAVVAVCGDELLYVPPAATTPS
jgi:hypothetical protein